MSPPSMTRRPIAVPWFTGAGVKSTGGDDHDSVAQAALLQLGSAVNLSVCMGEQLAPVRAKINKIAVGKTFDFGREPAIVRALVQPFLQAGDKGGEQHGNGPSLCRRLRQTVNPPRP